jgi:hypothetical protein
MSILYIYWYICDELKREEKEMHILFVHLYLFSL